MDHYRLYFLQNDHIREARVIEAEDDPAALSKAEEHRGGHALELWLGSRRVGRFDPIDR